jgi:hypothetical protein
MREYLQVDERKSLLSVRSNLLVNPEPFWTRLRELLAGRGIDPASCVVDFWSEDGNMEEGWVVTPERRVFSFDLHYGKGDLTSQAETATFTRWEEITAEPERRRLPRGRLQVALEIAAPSKP